MIIILFRLIIINYSNLNGIIIKEKIKVGLEGGRSGTEVHSDDDLIIDKMSKEDDVTCK